MKGITEEEIEQIMKQGNENLVKGIEIANKYSWGLTNFKRFISQFLKTESDEDQWTWDFESYCGQLTGLKDYRWVHPMHWAVEYYQDRWDIDEMNKSLDSLIAKTK